MPLRSILIIGVNGSLCVKFEIMEPVPLNPGKYGGTYKLIGGQLCFDLINTVSWPDMAKEHDWLDQPANVILWGEAVGLIKSPTVKLLKARPTVKLQKELSEIHGVREALRQVFMPISFGNKPDRDSMLRLNDLLHTAVQHRYIDPDKFTWTWEAPATLVQMIAPVIWNAAEVLTELDHKRIKHCHKCEWIFYDTTRNQNRKWCDVEDCGSRDKALRYYHRHKSGRTT